MEANQFGKKEWTPDRIGNIAGNTYLITGTTSGTGFEAAKILLSKVPKQSLTVDGWESQMDVNYFGHFTLQAMLFPLIEKSKGRIVTVVRKYGGIIPPVMRTVFIRFSLRADTSLEYTRAKSPYRRTNQK